VKENDLAHGQWEKWLESIEITPRTAQRMIQSYEQFKNATTSSYLPASKSFLTMLLHEQPDDDTGVRTFGNVQMSAGLGV
jgi:hypothetical protein